LWRRLKASVQVIAALFPEAGAVAVAAIGHYVSSPGERAPGLPQQLFPTSPLMRSRVVGQVDLGGRTPFRRPESGLAWQMNWPGGLFHMAIGLPYLTEERKKKGAAAESCCRYFFRPVESIRLRCKLPRRLLQILRLARHHSTAGQLREPVAAHLVDWFYATSFLQAGYPLWGIVLPFCSGREQSGHCGLGRQSALPIHIQYAPARPDCLEQFAGMPV